MHKLITEYLLQADKCSLPPLGVFTRTFNSAQIDNVSKLIYPPYYNFRFDDSEQPVSSAFVDFISYRKNVETSSAKDGIENFLEEKTQKIKDGKQLCFENVGCLQNDESGKIIFIPEEVATLLPVLPAEKVIHKDASHNVLVGDRETTSEVMKDYYSEQPVTSSRRWKLWAAILLAVGLIVIIFSLYNKGFAPDSIGNNHHLKVDDEPKTYKTVKSGK